LDLKLRQQMQIELKSIQHRVGITFIYGTHDQEEALTMSDRIAVFNHGKVEQIGTPAEIYERPATAFVAGFVGTSNILEGVLAQQVMGKAGTYAIRPEKIHIAPVGAPVPDDSLCVTGTICDVIYLGVNTRYVVALDMGGELVALEQNLSLDSTNALAALGRKVSLLWKREHSRPLQG